MSMSIDQQRWWWNLGLFLTVAAALLWLLSGVAAALLVAWLLAYLLVPFVEWLTAHGVRRERATALVFLLGLVSMVLLAVLLLPPLVTQVLHFLQALPDVLARLKIHGVSILSQMGLDISTEAEQWLAWVKVQVKSLSLESVSPWGHWGVSAVSGIFGAILGLFKLILVPLFAYYLLDDWQKIAAAVREHLPRKGKDTLLRLTGEMDDIISLFLRGQLSVCMMLALLYSLGLYVAGIPFALVIGLASGLLAFIPYVGQLIGLLTAALMSLGHFGVDQHLIGVAVVFVVVNLVESFYLTPKVLGDKLGLHPLVLLLALTVAADRFGFVGVMLAVPLTAAGAVVVREVDRRYLNSDLVASPD